ncbi:O-antigen translocase [Flavobacterium sp. DG1-102-2]|uniref:O-antigen translocase n=1 Tax=Flavobacterium sp. DG1-102-2 TaxID=3081663 RepID=UPI002948F542|nr:O-antigen translocase [Flavobacterium sp. DG1-102-2]MDV6168115.1 O-antigen translocase [Flavobacterium sp. DG1-102-2]
MGSIANILKKPIVKISSLNGVSVIVRILGGLVTSKAIAAYVGPGGMAIIENLRSFLTPVETYSMLGMQNGIIKYVAEYQKDEEKLYKILSTVFLSIFAVVIGLSILLLLLSGYCSEWIFRDYYEYAWVFKVLGFSLPWYAGSLLFIAILNGLGNYKQVIWLNISGNVLGVVLSVLLMWKFQTNGALLGLILFQSVFFVLTFYSIWKRFPRLPFIRIKYFDKATLRDLLSYSIMALFSALVAPLVSIFIRNNLIDNFSLDTAGMWVAMNRISSYYMMFATTMLSVYFLPKLSVAQSKGQTRDVFLSYYRSMLPLFGTGMILLYLLREFAVLFILKEDFLPVTDLFFWQLTGDFFKVGALILGYQFFAQKLTTAYLVSEAVSCIILYISSTILIAHFGVKGAVMGHALTYFIYWIMLAVYFRKGLFNI